MSRKTASAPPAIKKKERNETTETRQYKLITPLYGGGVEPEKADPITVVRASEVRGHLRFWWRATRGGAVEFEGSLEKMREREEEIFGSAAGDGKAGQSKVNINVSASPAQVQILDKVIIDKKGRKERVDVSDPKSPYSYAAFPLRPDKDNKKEKGTLVKEGITFSLTLTYPKTIKITPDDEVDILPDIEAALWAWEAFGGIGARTRRGFGALQRTDIGIPDELTTRDAEDWIKKGLQKHVVEDGKWHDAVPHLKTSILYKITSREDDGMQSWEHLIAALQSFRQTNARYEKESGRKSSYGMSRWPEPNEVRRFFNRKPALPLGVKEHDLVQKMPRAQFGLPIILHMAHDDGLKEKEIKLEGKKHDRLASPLILRPLICKDGAVGVALVLDTPRTPPSDLILKGVPKDPIVYSDLTDDEAKKIPMLNGEKDILKAFLDYLN